jgi:hypothetical protein
LRKKVFEVILDDGVWGQLVECGVGKGTAWAASKLGALHSVVTETKGKRAAGSRATKDR